MAHTKTGTGQAALITGGSGGIGLDLAECFAQNGYDLVLSHVRDGAREGMWKTAARLIRFGEPLRAARLAAALPTP